MKINLIKRYEVFRTAMILLVILFSFSCDKDDAVIYGDEQLPVFSLLDNMNFSLEVLDAHLYYEMTTYLEFLENGRIAQLCVIMPTDGNYRTTLWDLSDGSVITSVSIDALTRQVACVEIPVLSVEKGDLLAISVYSRDWIQYIAKEHQIAFYPTVRGDVRIISHGFHQDPVGFELPESFYSTLLEGLADVVFEPEID